MTISLCQSLIKISSYHSINSIRLNFYVFVICCTQSVVPPSFYAADFKN